MNGYCLIDSVLQGGADCRSGQRELSPQEPVSLGLLPKLRRHRLAHSLHTTQHRTAQPVKSESLSWPRGFCCRQSLSFKPSRFSSQQSAKTGRPFRRPKDSISKTHRHVHRELVSASHTHHNLRDTTRQCTCREKPSQFPIGLSHYPAENDDLPRQLGSGQTQ